MNPTPPNETLSAYLDDELSAGERQEVERWLAADPAARQLLDELRTVSSAVRSLPSLSLGVDLSAAVLRQAQELRPAAADDPAITPAASPVRSVARRFLRPRTLVWTAAALIVGLVISRYEQSQQPKSEQQTAQQAAETGAPRAPSSIGPLPGTVAKTPGPGGVRAQAVEPKAVAEGDDELLITCYLTNVAKQQDLPARLTKRQVFLEELPARLNDVPKRDRSVLPPVLQPAGQRTTNYAEIDSDQLEGLLIELVQHPDLYPIVAVEPSPRAKGQESWRAYHHVYGQPRATPAPARDAQGAGRKQRVVISVQPVQPATPQK